MNCNPYRTRFGEVHDDHRIGFVDSDIHDRLQAVGVGTNTETSLRALRLALVATAQVQRRAISKGERPHMCHLSQLVAPIWHEMGPHKIHKVFATIFLYYMAVSNICSCIAKYSHNIFIY